MSILIHGSLAFDRIMDFPGQFQEHILPEQIHNISVSFFIQRLEERFGGTGGNIAYNFYLLGKQKEVHIVSTAGNDFQSYLDHLQSLGISTKHIEMYDDLKTAGAYIMTDMRNNQITGFYPGADVHPTSFSLQEYAAQDQESYMIFSPRNNKPDIMRYAAECKKLGVKMIFDPGQTIPIFEPEELKTLIQGSYMVTLNDYELQLVLDKTKLTQEELLKMTEVLVTTLGENGSTIQTQSDTISIPACKKLEVKDPTGAGDAYRAGLITGLMEGLSLEDAGHVASLTATYAVEHYGTQDHRFTREEFKERFQQNFSSPCPLP